MRGASLLIVAVVTSAAGAALGVRTGLLEPGRWWLATRQALEVLGFGFVFLALNVGLLVVGTITVRSLSDSFVSVYIANDLSLVGLAVLQGVLFSQWRRSSLHDDGATAEKQPISTSAT